MKRLLILSLMLGITCFFTGCKIQIFEEEKSPYAIQNIDAANMMQDTFYVKNGTKFNVVVTPDKNFSSVAKGNDSKRVIWTFGNEESVPTLYKDEIIAYASSSTSRIESLSIERFKDLGYSFGFYNGGFDTDGYYCFNGTNSVEQSNSHTRFGQNKSYIRIDTINGQKISNTMVCPAGTIVGLDAFGKYEVGYYTGTYYRVEEWTANSHIFQSFEYYATNDITQTKNGYLQIKMPEDLKSGYYLINGVGLFKYIAEDKSTAKDISSIDMNEPYKIENGNNETKPSVQEFGVFVNEKKANMTFSMFYDTTSGSPENCTLISPAGQEYIMESTEGSNVFTYALSEVMQGEWIIRVEPATIKVTNVTCKKMDITQEEVIEQLNEEIVEITLEKGQTNRLLKIEYAGVMPESATVIAPDGKSYRLTIVEDNVLGYNFMYAREGIYEVHIYYKEDFLLKDAYMYDNSNYETEIITVTQ